jgi:hypothetical protein
MRRLSFDLQPETPGVATAQPASRDPLPRPDGLS